MAAYFDTTRRLVRDQTGSAYTSLSTARTDVSIALWYRPAAIGSTKALINIRELRTTSPTEYFRILEGINASESRFSCGYDDATASAQTNFSPNMDANDVWYLIVAVFGSNGTAMTYTSIKNFFWKAGTGGSPTESTPTSFTARAQTQDFDNLVIGSNAVSSQGNGANGYIAEISVWTKALDASEALDLTTKPASALSSYSASCINYWPLSTDLTDSKGGLTLVDPLSTMTFDGGIHPSLSSGGTGRHKLFGPFGGPFHKIV